MATFENLEILIDVIDQFSEDLNRLLLQLGEVEAAVESVDDITIDVDVRGQGELTALQAQMATLGAMDIGGTTGVGGGGGSDGGGGTSRSMKKTADAADEASKGLLKMDLRMTDVHNAMARLVPLILVLVGTIPALQGAFVALAGAAVAAAGALGALTVFGALGAAAEAGGGDISEGFMEMFREVRQDFLDAFMPLAERLAPLFEDALDGLDRFFQAVANQGDALANLSDTARDFGQFLIENIPPFLGEVARFADALGPAFGKIAEAIGEMGFLESIAGFLAEVLPAFFTFLGLITKLVPHILEMSVGFLQVANVILFAANVIFDLVTLMGLFDKQVGAAIAGVLALYGAFLLANTAFLAFLRQLVIAAGGAIFKFIIALAEMSAAEIAAAAATRALQAAVIGLAAAIALTGIGLILTVLGGIASGAAAASSNIDQATKSLKKFQQQQSSMTGGNNPFAHPEVKEGSISGSSRFGGTSVNITVEGDADEKTIREQVQNGLHRIERPKRSR